METRDYLTPEEIANTTVEVGIKKTNLSFTHQLILGILAGAFIAFASEGSNMAAFNLFRKPETYGLGKTMAGLIFGTGLMLVILAGGELFTGNALIIISVLEKKVKLREMLRNWCTVYIGNLIGSLLIVFMMVQSGLFNSGANGLGGETIKIAAYKVNLPFMSALYLGIMGNWIVCLAVWLAFAAKSMTGKILGIFFPIWLFVTSGFEHSIANMYYIPAGILAKSNINWVTASYVTSEKLGTLNWNSFIFNNLVPVTIGNIIGGTIFVGVVYWFVYLKDNKSITIQKKVENKINL
ncbi:formate/nitrite transporter family protein [Clostridium cochlearium]|uniref:Formate transporter n=3 Tax=Clostridium TaxID=1485 RepID=A0A239ZNJ7_CLOCO|nr:formate/nitrite transporter family protein [Clostridium cochlearium]MBE6064053.1 formate/nitrite transporter family protein [Clostridium cochlearium]MBU5270494.1 formate/nitrite transporter family protein [Clostridium cochlearium]MCG4571186.1 formate/nitrite transporter family protein [Clostridium cochlearium]MCG4578714.1 formate/nitrite transporter family protein [Clostridium cochlearium]NME95724.1 formate/nitrite transporter family protein [Clostridium cochlearium]